MKKLSLDVDKSVSRLKDDSFQRYGFAKRIAELIKSNTNQDSLVIGIYGRWGEGKTSVMNFISTELSKSKQNVLIKFNPWMFSNEDQLLLSFFQELASALNASMKSRKEKVGEFLKTYASSIGSLTTLLGLNAEDLLNAVGNKLTNKPLEFYKSKINKFIDQSGKKITIFIDDIDRLTVEEVQTVFKLVKLTANFNKTTYVLSFDDDFVASALSSKYSKGGHDFLEKIIQLPLKLPKAQKAALRKFTLNRIQEVINNYSVSLEEKDLKRFSVIFDNCLLPSINNPRIATRYSNAVSFSIPLLIGECNFTDMLLIEGVKVVFPNLYSFIRDNFVLLTSNYSGLDGVYNAADRGSGLKKLNEFMQDQKDQDVVKELIQQLFPQIKAVLGNIHYGENSFKEWYLEKRICSSHYFNRYFTYTVIEGDISDNLFTKLYGQLIETDFINRESDLIDQLKSTDPEKLLYKIQLNEETLTPQGASALALNLSFFENYFPSKELTFSFMSPFNQAIYLIARLIQRQENNSRLQLATNILLRTKTLEFGLAIWRRLHPKVDLQESKWVLTEEDFKNLSRSYYQSISKTHNLNQLFQNAKEGDLDDLLNIWAEFDEATLKLFTNKKIQENRNGFLRLFHAYCETTYSSSSPKPYKSGFSRGQYLKLSKVVDINLFFESSIKYFGDSGDLSLVDTTITMHEVLSDERLVRIFQKIHLEKDSN